jgi:hypothetical protein
MESTDSRSEEKRTLFRIDRLAVIFSLLDVRAAVFAVLAFALVYVPYRTFDLVSLPVLLGMESAILIVGMLWAGRFKKHLLMVAMCVVLFFAVGEVFFRVYNFGVRGLDFAHCTSGGLFHPVSPKKTSPYTATGLEPYSTIYFWGKKFTTNREGFRSRDYPVEKGPDVYRIVISGASATQGNGVSDDETYPAVLEDLLNHAGLEKRVEILNFSKGGNDVGNMLYLIENHGMKYSPDLLIMVANNQVVDPGPLEIAAPHRMAPYEGTWTELLLDPKYKILSRTFFLAKVIDKERQDKLITQTVLPLRKDSSYLRRAREATPQSGSGRDYSAFFTERYGALIEAMTALKKLAGDRPAYLCLLRNFKDFDDPVRIIDFRREVKRHAAREGVGVLDTFEIDMSGLTSREFVIYLGDLHPSERVHSMYAHYLYERLIDVIREGTAD